MFIENVEYFKYRATYHTTEGKRRSVTFHCPGAAWIYGTLASILDERSDVHPEKPIRVKEV